MITGFPDAQGGNLKNSEQGGSVYFFGSKIWLKFTFLGEKNWNYFFGLEIFEIIFLRSLKMTKIIFFLGGGGRSRYRLGYFFVHNSFKKKDGSTRYTHITFNRGRGTSIIPSMAVEKKMYTVDQTCNMVDFLADNIFVKFRECIFHQVIGIPIGTNCAPFLTDLFLYSY